MGTVTPGQAAADAVLARYIAHTDLWSAPATAEARVVPSLILAQLGLPDRLFDRLAELWDRCFELAIAGAVDQARVLADNCPEDE